MKKPYKQTYDEIYAIHAKYGRITPDKRDDAYWEAVIKETGEYSEANPGAFVVDMLVAMTNELERSGKP